MNFYGIEILGYIPQYEILIDVFGNTSNPICLGIEIASNVNKNLMMTLVYGSL